MGQTEGLKRTYA